MGKKRCAWDFTCPAVASYLLPSPILHVAAAVAHSGHSIPVGPHDGEVARNTAAVGDRTTEGCRPIDFLPLQLTAAPLLPEGVTEPWPISPD